MTTASADDRGSVARAGLNIRRWTIWSLPRPALAFVLALDGLAAMLMVLGLTAAQPAKSDLSRFLLLAVLSVIHSEAEDHTDRLRRNGARRGAYADSQSVWTFAGALLLPAGYAALLIAFIYGHAMLRSRRHRWWWLPHRLIFTGAAVTLAAILGSWLYHRLGELSHVPPGAAQALGVLGAIAAYRSVSAAAVAVVSYLATRPADFRAGLSGRDQIATLILGAFTAQTIVQMPWLTPAVLVLIAVLYRGVRARDLEVEATTDGKTGLLNARAWRELAQRHLWRAVREDQAAALLVIDLDRFKALNDKHGHLAGDIALTAVAESIKHELRDYDAVGRYGGEEFVALLPNAGANQAMRAARRVSESIEAADIPVDDGPGVRLTASIGVATYPTYGAELDELIKAADAALYVAKAEGRNAIRLADGRRPASATSHEPQSTPA